MNRLILVPGANKGIGLEIVRELAALPGYHILLGSRSEANSQTAIKLLNEAGQKLASTVEPI